MVFVPFFMKMIVGSSFEMIVFIFWGPRNAFWIFFLGGERTLFPKFWRINEFFRWKFGGPRKCFSNLGGHEICFSDFFFLGGGGREIFFRVYLKSSDSLRPLRMYTPKQVLWKYGSIMQRLLNFGWFDWFLTSFRKNGLFQESTKEWTSEDYFNVVRCTMEGF